MAVKDFVDVYNAGATTYEEEWMDNKYSIAPGASIKMKRRDAVNFLGSYPGINIEKNLEIRRDGSVIDNVVSLGTKELQKVFVSMKDGKEFSSQEDLDKHLKQFEAEVVVNDDIPEPESTEDSGNGKIKCPLCEKKFEKIRGLKVHLSSH
jgi:hypothetical protein